jgi:hypothetical protein
VADLAARQRVLAPEQILVTPEQLFSRLN